MTEQEIRTILRRQREYFATGATLSWEFRAKQLGKLKASLQCHEIELNDALRHGADAVPVVFFDDGADAGDLGIERQVIAAGVTGYALVLHDARDTGELVLHIVQPLRHGRGTGQQHEGRGSQQFFLHIVLLGGRCRVGITGFAGGSRSFFSQVLPKVNRNFYY